MDVSAPHAAVSPGPEGEILIALLHTTKGLTGRQVALRVRHASQASVNRALQRLAEQGIIEGQPVGRAMLFTLNREHLAFPAVSVLGGLRAELLRRVGERLKSEPRPVHASLFGST